MGFISENTFDRLTEMLSAMLEIFLVSRFDKGIRGIGIQGVQISSIVVKAVGGMNFTNKHQDLLTHRAKFH